MFKGEREKTRQNEKRELYQLCRALKTQRLPGRLLPEIAYADEHRFTATRMLGYLYRVTSPRAEDVVDEMLAILSDRKAWIEKKQS